MFLTSSRSDKHNDVTFIVAYFDNLMLSLKYN